MYVEDYSHVQSTRHQHHYPTAKEVFISMAYSIRAGMYRHMSLLDGTKHSRHHRHHLSCKLSAQRSKNWDAICQFSIRSFACIMGQAVVLHWHGSGGDLQATDSERAFMLYVRLRSTGKIYACVSLELRGRGK